MLHLEGYESRKSRTLKEEFLRDETVVDRRDDLKDGFPKKERYKFPLLFVKVQCDHSHLCDGFTGRLFLGKEDLMKGDHCCDDDDMKNKM